VRAALFPMLADVDLLRVYVGFRPWVPDHLPIIGEDPQVRGLWHATGHEGAGIGLAPATGQLIRAGITDTPPPVDPLPFRVARPSLMAIAGTARVAHG
jgi:D-hydroxyproline dehydrogenase subunit beta